MARRTQSVETVRKHLTVASQVVKGEQAPEGTDLEAISQTLLDLAGPHGARHLQDEKAPGVTSATHQNQAILMPIRLRSALQKAAAKAAPKGKSVTDTLGEALDRNLAALLAGEVQPREIPKTARGMAEESGNLNAPVDKALLVQAREQAEQIGQRLGYSGKATVPKLAMSLLLEEFGIAYEPPASKLAGMAQLHLPVPPRLAAGIREAMDYFTESELRRLVDEGLRRAVAGEWEPWEVPKAPQGSEYERELLTTYVDQDLFDEARAASKGLRDRLGYRVSPQTIATGYLASELGLEDLFDEEYGLTAETD